MVDRVKKCVIGTLLAVAVGYPEGGLSQAAIAITQPSQKKPSVQKTSADPKEVRSGAGQNPTSGEYVIGESDALNINVWKEPDVSQGVVVRPDGKISLPLIGEVLVSGLTPVQAQVLLASKFQSYLTNPQVTVTVTDIRSRVVFLTGEVGKPGTYPLLAPTTVLQLIAHAGGLGQFANKKGIYILRTTEGKQERFSFNYKQVIKGEKVEQNILLRPGDTVVVP